MRSPSHLTPLLLLLLLAGCGGPAHTMDVGLSPGQEAAILVTDASGMVTIANTGTTALKVTWPAGTSPLLIAPGTEAGRALDGDARIRVFAADGLGGRATVEAEAAGVSVTVTSRPSGDPKAAR